MTDLAAALQRPWELEYVRPYRLIDRAIADAVALALGTDPGEDE